MAIRTENGDAERLHLLTRSGREVVSDLAMSERVEKALELPFPIGHDCGALVGSDWWVVNPVTGRLSTSRKVDWPMPEGRWMGLAAAGAEGLFLASADQSLHHVSTIDGRELARFPASVSPSRRIHFGECTPVLAGEGWLGTFDPLRSLLTAYDPRGEWLGSIRFDRRLGLGSHNIWAVGAAGRRLGLGRSDTHVSTFEVSLAPHCAGAEQR